MGRKAKPARLRIVEGHRGHRPIPKEPNYHGVPTCPKHLDGEARKEWRRILKDLSAAGVITRPDRAALAAYCQLWSRVVRLEKVVLETGEVLSDEQVKEHYAKGGEKVVQKRVKFYRSPFAVELHQCYDQMKAYLVEFGLTPASRSKVAPPVSDSEDDALERFMAEGERRKA